MKMFRHAWRVTAALWLGAQGLCPGIVGRLEIDAANYEALAAQQAFGGMVSLKAGCG